MITSSTRAKLRGMAQNLDPIFHIGKNGITENLLADIDTALDAKELIKIAVLKNSDYTAKDALAEICDALGAEPVCSIGNKMALYRLSSKNGVKHVL